jgi:hypothetical protein
LIPYLDHLNDPDFSAYYFPIKSHSQKKGKKMTTQDELKLEIAQVEEAISQIKNELMNIGDMRPGNLTQQSHPSKSPNHPYYQLSYTHNSRSRTEYIREAFVEEIEGQIAEYERFRQLISQWTTLAIQKATAQLKLRRQTTPRATKRPTPQKRR